MQILSKSAFIFEPLLAWSACILSRVRANVGTFYKPLFGNQWDTSTNDSGGGGGGAQRERKHLCARNFAYLHTHTRRSLSFAPKCALKIFMNSIAFADVV